jgi:hypothetical protein
MCIVYLHSSIFIYNFGFPPVYCIYSNITSFFRFVNKRAIHRLGIISLAHAPVHVTDFPIVNVHVDELSSARIWQHKLCAILFANVNITVFQSKYTTVFVLLDISELKKCMEARMCFEFWHGLADKIYYYPPTHVKTQNTFWLPWFIS